MFKREFQLNSYTCKKNLQLIKHVLKSENSLAINKMYVYNEFQQLRRFKMIQYMALLFGGAASGAANGTASKGSMVSTILLMVALFAVMYFVMIRPQRKKQKEDQEMRDSIQIGDEITTIGGISGRVVTVKEDALVIETGSDKTKLKITRWAIQTNNTADDRLQAQREAQAAAKAAEKEAKKGGQRRKRSDVVTDSEDISEKE